MSAKSTGIGSLLAICLVLALWLLRSESQPDAIPGAARPETQAPARSGPLRASEVAGLEAGDPKVLSAEAAAAKPARKLVVPRRPPKPGDKTLDLIARLFRPPGPTAPAQEVEAWEESPLQEYLYPDGHPCAGQPRGGVSASTLTGAANAALGPVIESIPDLDTPRCHIQGNWAYSSVNKCARGLNREEPASVQGFISCLDGLRQGPNAYPAEMWLPCPPDHPKLTTMREHLEELVRNQVDEMLGARNCAVE